MSKIILTADLHLTSNPADEYRWGLFPWLVAKVRKHKPKMVIIAGDLTDFKDNHPARLVNRVVERLGWLANLTPVHVLRGNHDFYRDPDNPFFGFLSHVPNITFHTRFAKQGGVLFLPRAEDPLTEWSFVDFNAARLIVMHQTVNGSLASNGYKLTGLNPRIFNGVRDGIRIFSGDIHPPQRRGRVEYIGSPYHVRFGDRFKPRVVLLEDFKRVMNLHYRTLSRHSVEIADPRELLDLDVRKGDQIKVATVLPMSGMDEWPKLRDRVRAICTERGLELFSNRVKLKPTRIRVQKQTPKMPNLMDDASAFRRFCDDEDLGDDTAELGARLL